MDPIRERRFLGERIEATLQPAPGFLDAGEGIGALQDVQDLHRGSHGRHLSPEGETEKRFFEDGHDVRPTSHTGYWEAVPHRLAEACQVWRHTEFLLRAPE